MKITTPRILIGGTNSGSGKTTIVCGILQALKNRGLAPAPFKCGPDYIDPMFHKEVLGLSSRNLDLFLMGENGVKNSLYDNAKGADIAVIEGVMGYYDGLGGTTTVASSYDVARVTGTPTILVVNAKGISISVVAIIKGFMELRENANIKGVILNNVSEMTFKMLKPLIEGELGIKAVGYLPNLPSCELKSRHLGLVTAGELESLSGIITELGNVCKHSIDIDEIIKIAGGATDCELTPMEIRRDFEGLRIGIAMDSAFCFYYRDNLDLIEKMGAELVYFSPLEDKRLPENLNGVIFGGGYPELYLAELAENGSMKKSILDALEEGLPALCECGGFMYLGETIADEKGVQYDMVGYLSGGSENKKKLNRFGYITLSKNEENFMLKHSTINAHEFHYWDSEITGQKCLATKPTTKREYTCMVEKGSVFGGYPHIHYFGNEDFIINFLRRCNHGA